MLANPLEIRGSHRVNNTNPEADLWAKVYVVWPRGLTLLALNPVDVWGRASRICIVRTFWSAFSGSVRVGSDSQDAKNHLFFGVARRIIIV